MWEEYKTGGSEECKGECVVLVCRRVCGKRIRGGLEEFKRGVRGSVRGECVV